MPSVRMYWHWFRRTDCQQGHRLRSGLSYDSTSKSAHELLRCAFGWDVTLYRQSPDAVRAGLPIRAIMPALYARRERRETFNVWCLMTALHGIRLDFSHVIFCKPSCTTIRHAFHH